MPTPSKYQTVNTEEMNRALYAAVFTVRILGRYVILERYLRMSEDEMTPEQIEHFVALTHWKASLSDALLSELETKIAQHGVITDAEVAARVQRECEDSGERPVILRPDNGSLSEG